MKSPDRLPAEQRRAAIIAAVRRVFAERGFHGTTTRALAAAAGVSEALLFKYFPDKSALFSAMQMSCCTGEDQHRYERIESLEPSASTLVLMVHHLVSIILRAANSSDDLHAVQDRLTLRSLAEDGEFARLLLGPLASRWVPKVEQCLAAASTAGDTAGPLFPGVGGWLIYNLAAMIRYHQLPAPPAVEYGASSGQLVEQVVWFALRGIGLKEEAIRRDYNPRALSLFD